MNIETIRGIFETLAKAFINVGGDKRLVENLRKELEQEFDNANLD